MAKKYTVRLTNPKGHEEYEFDDEYYEFKDEMLYINKGEETVMMDLQTSCKNQTTAYKRFYKAITEAQKNGEFAEGYDLLADLLIDPSEVDWEINSPIVCSPEAWKDLGYIMVVECSGDNLWYLWLNVKHERMAA